ncbi:Kynurenine formamidase [Marininema mesophilum]|uniref:Kynurenine formamidase n=1 Tax=Marininema mesophilum TaxID=1048340 RepID=A0A1H2U640_9BACL|nr:arylformamidase [Marininema mesophilum]SDW51645.1 Kynurenine formamidase [Marininema mesophilum]
MTKWIDISQPLTKDIPIWPGDTGFICETAHHKSVTGSVNVGSLTMSLHTGTHIDAPYHFDDDGKRVSDLDISVYGGRAKVIRLPEGTKVISPEALANEKVEGAERLLLHTKAWPDRGGFPEWIPPVAPELAPWLQERGICLLGIDIPSVDSLDSKDLPAHHALAYYGVYILEGVVLDHVEPGEYELFAFPLALEGADGSPVRAVLRQI